jgi:hypothetical protein
MIDRKQSHSNETLSATGSAGATISRFGIIHHGTAWQCRLDATGESWIGSSHEPKARSEIPVDRMQAMLSSSDDAAGVADAVIAEFIKRCRRRLPPELVVQIREFTLSWARSVCRSMRRQAA